MIFLSVIDESLVTCKKKGGTHD